MASFTADAYLNTDGGHWYSYKDGSTGVIGGGGGGSGAPLLLGNSQKYFSEVNTTGGQMSVRRSYDTAGTPPSSFAASNMSGDPGLGVASFGSWTAYTAVKAVAAGTYTAQLTDLFSSFPAGHKVDWVFCHEANEHVGEGDGWTLTDFKNANDVIRTAFDNSSADPAFHRVGTLLTANGFRLGLGRTWFVSGVQMFVAVDSYEYWRPQSAPADPVFGDHSQHRTTSWLWGDGVTGGVNDTATWLGHLPILCGEYGWHYFPSSDPDYATGRRDLRIQQTVDYCDQNITLHGNPVEVLCVYNSDLGAHGPWWTFWEENWTTKTDHSTLDSISLAKWQSILASHAKYTGA